MLLAVENDRDAKEAIRAVVAWYKSHPDGDAPPRVIVDAARALLDLAGAPH